MSELEKLIWFVLSIGILLFILRIFYKHLTSDRIRKYRLYRMLHLKKKKEQERIKRKQKNKNN